MAEGRTTPAKPKAETNGEAKVTADLLLNRRRPVGEVTVDIDGEAVTLPLKAIPRPDYDDLVEKYPILESSRPGWPFDVETFAPALIAATVVEPQLSIEEATRIWREWDPAEASNVWNEVLNLNTRRRSSPKASTTPASGL